MKVIPPSLTSASELLLPISTLLTKNAPKLKSMFLPQEQGRPLPLPPTTCTHTNQRQNRQFLQVLPTSVQRKLPKDYRTKQQIHYYKYQHQASTRISAGKAVGKVGVEGSSATTRTGERPTRTSAAAAAILVPLIDTGGNSNGNGNDNVISSSNSECDCNYLDRISILFTKRSNHLKEHANEISFPGGHLDPLLDGDCIIQTAIRETREELMSISPPPEQSEPTSPSISLSSPVQKYKYQHEYDFDNDLIMIGQMETIPSAKLVPVTPFVAYFKHQVSPNDIQTLFPGNKSEVAQVQAQLHQR